MRVENWGQVPYLEGHARQLELVHAVYKGAEERIIICSHHPVVTLGKKSTAEDLLGWSGEVVQVERGGKATYHGPGQLIAYPIIDLRRRGQDIHLYLRNLEQAMIQLLSGLGLSASGNPTPNNPEQTGVWVGQHKIGSIGVAVKRWITYHGLALNLYHEPLAFSGINPCGFNPSIMTSLEALTSTKVQRSTIEAQVSQSLLRLLAATSQNSLTL
ncbi:MAG: lipoyl(octanoyl) transferase LipB [Halobacteriovoraceae bacterium]|nr:lipoyl(octanoyl) transferase LipB [Halobacteriovoraceae bacterium]